MYAIKNNFLIDKRLLHICIITFANSGLSMTTNTNNELSTAIEAMVSAEETLRTLLGCYSLDEFKKALNACENVRIRLDNQLREEKGVIGPISFYNFWTGEDSFAYGGANTTIVSKIIALYLKQYGIYICSEGGSILSDNAEVLSSAWAHYVVKQPKYFPKL